MKTYTLHCRYVVEETFLQMSHCKEELTTVHRNKVTHWIAEMGLTVDPKNTFLVIREDDVPILIARYAATRFAWKPYTIPCRSPVFET